VIILIARGKIHVGGTTTTQKMLFLGASGFTMIDEVSYSGTRLRSLECWLPLAQEINRIEGWNCDAASLEVLILVALPSLFRACSAAEAHAILRHIYAMTWDGQT
jgi:hypothetical protein